MRWLGIGIERIGNPWWLSADPEIANFKTGGGWQGKGAEGREGGAGQCVHRQESVHCSALCLPPPIVLCLLLRRGAELPRCSLPALSLAEGGTEEGKRAGIQLLCCHCCASDRLPADCSCRMETRACKAAAS